MRRALLRVVLCSSVLFFDVDLALAKKGGGGRGPSGPSQSSKPIRQPKQQPRIIKGATGSPQSLRNGIQPSTLSGDQRRVDWTPKADPRPGNEERKLDHRLQTAQHLRDHSMRELEERKRQHLFDVAQQLRDIAGRNGNQNLLRTAEKIEQVANSRYERNRRLWEGQASEISQSEVTPVPSSNLAARP